MVYFGYSINSAAEADTVRCLSVRHDNFGEGFKMRYEIKGGNLPVVICHLNEGESMSTERGSMSWMSPNMKMETSGGGSIGRAFGRLFSGEAIFQNIYTAMGGPGMIAFASSFPGSIIPVDIAPGNDFVVQKSGFLASERGVELSVFFRERRPLSECSCDCIKNPEVVSSICCVDTAMVENAWMVPAAAVRSEDVFSRFVISVAAIDSAPS